MTIPSRESLERILTVLQQNNAMLIRYSVGLEGGYAFLEGEGVEEEVQLQAVNLLLKSRLIERESETNVSTSYRVTRKGAIVARSWNKDT